MDEISRRLGCVNGTVLAIMIVVGLLFLVVEKIIEHRDLDSDTSHKVECEHAHNERN